MIVGTMTVQIHLSGITSLKEKRSIVKSVVSRLASRFNASVAEVAHHDSKQSAVIGIAVVSTETRHVHQQLDKILEFMNGDGRFYIGETERETF